MREVRASFLFKNKKEQEERKKEKRNVHKNPVRWAGLEQEGRDSPGEARAASSG